MSTATAERAAANLEGRGPRGAPDPICGAKKPKGRGLCQMPPGWGTDHAGVGRCKFHSGMTTSGRASAAIAAGIRLGNDAGIIMGSPLDVEPHQMLLACVQITAGEIAWYTVQIANLQLSDVIRDTIMGERLHVYIKERQLALDRAAKFAKMCLDAGVEERRVRVAEQYGAIIAELIKGILNELQLTSAQQKRAPKIVRKHLTLIEGTFTELEPEADAA